MKVDEFFTQTYPHHLDSVTPLPTEFDCYRTLIETYEQHCETFDDYSMKYMKTFVSECEGLKSFPDAQQFSVSKLEGYCKAFSFTQ